MPARLVSPCGSAHGRWRTYTDLERADAGFEAECVTLTL